MERCAMIVIKLIDVFSLGYDWLEVRCNWVKP